MKHVLDSLKDAVKSEQRSISDKREIFHRQGMSDALSQVESRLRLWFIHQTHHAWMLGKNLKRRVVKNINISDGRYRKFEWYEGKRFYSLALRWGKDQPEAEIALQIQDINTLDNEYYVYTGDEEYNALKKKAKEKGVRGVRSKSMLPNWRVM